MKSSPIWEGKPLDVNSGFGFVHAAGGMTWNGSLDPSISNISITSWADEE